MATSPIAVERPSMTVSDGCYCCGGGEDACVCGWQGGLCVDLDGLPSPFGLSYPCDPNGQYDVPALFTPPSTAARAWQYVDSAWCSGGCLPPHLLSVLVECGGGQIDGAPQPLVVTVNVKCGGLDHVWQLWTPGPITAEDCEAGYVMADQCRAKSAAGISWFDCDGSVTATITPGPCGEAMATRRPAAAARRRICLYAEQVERLAGCSGFRCKHLCMIGIRRPGSIEAGAVREYLGDSDVVLPSDECQECPGYAPRPKP